MAVARARHVDPRVLRWIESWARLAGEPKIQREAERARARTGHSLELTAGELRRLLQTSTPHATGQVLRQMADELNAAEKWETDRDAATRSLIEANRQRLLHDEDTYVASA